MELQKIVECIQVFHNKMECGHSEDCIFCNMYSETAEIMKEKGFSMGQIIGELLKIKGAK